MEKLRFREHFGTVETIKPHEGYIHNVGRALTITILGTLCGLKNITRILQWAKAPQVRTFLQENFEIYELPSKRWLGNLLAIIKPESLNEKFMVWSKTMLPEFLDGLTISFDGKTICSTGKMGEYEKPLHILSAHLAELGLTMGQQTVDEKSNEIPAMQELLKLVDIRGCMVVADALNCQTKTAETIIDCGGDYLLNAKGNQETLEEDIKDYVNDNELRSDMETESTREKNGGRIEFRRAYVSHDVSWMVEHLPKWRGLACFGAINRRVTKNGHTSDEWHFYISSCKLTASELLYYARNEWSIESMHWILDVHFGEDSCRTRDKNANQVLNIVRKIVINNLHEYQRSTGSKAPLTELMFSCLLDCSQILNLMNWQ